MLKTMPFWVNTSTLTNTYFFECRSKLNSYFFLKCQSFYDATIWKLINKTQMWTIDLKCHCHIINKYTILHVLYNNKQQLYKTIWSKQSFAVGKCHNDTFKSINYHVRCVSSWTTFMKKIFKDPVTS